MATSTEAAGKTPAEGDWSAPRNWSLTTALWTQLTAARESGPSPLGGTAAALLEEAARERNGRIRQSEAELARWEGVIRLMPGARAFVEGESYWSRMEQALAGKSISALDPTLAGRRQLWFLDPYRVAPVAEESSGTGPSPEELRELAPFLERLPKPSSAEQNAPAQ